MFSHLFNTYEAVTPPPKSKTDVKNELQVDTNDEKIVVDPLGLGPLSRVPYDVEEPSDQPFAASPSLDIIQETETPTISPAYSTNNQLANNIINTGRSFLGSNYTYGGSSPSTGFDCSGFISYIFKQNGVDVPRDTAGLFKVGQEVSLSNAQPGDIICSKGRGPSGRHVQVVSRVENNKVYVLEAKGKNYGIVEGPLTKKDSDIISVRRVLNSSLEDPVMVNQDIQMPSTQSSFSNKKDFAQALVSGYRRALAQNNLDPNYAYILTAQAAIESGWGKHQSGKFNFGGIKAGKNTPGTYKSTTEWSPSKGYYKSVEKFRDFTSIDDYCNYRIQLLGNSRYNVFNQFSPSQAYDIVYHMLKKGYGSDKGGRASVKYAKDAQKIYNSILNMVS